MARPIRAYLDAQALRHNLRIAKKFAVKAKTLAVIKANAYGHGLVWAGRVLAEADGFGVASTEEAIELREAGIAQPICLLEGFFNKDELALIYAYRLSPVIHDMTQVDALEKAALPGPIDVWIKLDTGMHRLGFPSDSFTQALARIRACRNVCAISVMTHFSCADESSNDYTKTQMAHFFNIAKDLGLPLSLANSAGIVAWPASHADWVRPGIMLYGANPLTGDAVSGAELKPVMTLQSALIAIHEYRKGDTVGYGGEWRCPEAMRVGVITAGYGDGYPRHARAGTPVLINGKAVPLIGRVSMDMITVDLRELPHAKVGDTATLWGEGLPVETIAAHAGTISYEILCHVTQRVPRIPRHDD